MVVGPCLLPAAVRFPDRASECVSIFCPRAVPTAGLREQVPKRRVVVRDLVRVESRNFWYTGEGSGTSSSVRFRNRVEFLVARYLLAD